MPIIITSAYIPKVMAHSSSNDNLATTVEASTKKEEIKKVESVTKEVITTATEKAKTEKGKLMTIEEKNLGNVQVSAYLYYLRSGGIVWFFLGNYSFIFTIF